MSLTFGFYNSLNGDRKYNAEQMSSLFDGVLQDGVFASIGQAMMVTAGTGMQVLVGTGRAWFNHTWTLNDAQMPLDIEASDLILKRIDAVVLEVNNNMAVRTNTIKVIKGTPASADTAAKPAMTNTDGVFQHPLAYISVNPAASTITGGDIENVVGKDKETKFVTSICESVSIEDLFSQWTGQFTTWFDNIKAQLEGDVVTNLQRQIDENKTGIKKIDTSIEKLKDTSKLGCVGSLYFKLNQSSLEPPGLIAPNAYYSIEKYPELYEQIGYKYGEEIYTIGNKKSYTYDSISESYDGFVISPEPILDPVTGKIYLAYGMTNYSGSYYDGWRRFVVTNPSSTNVITENFDWNKGYNACMYPYICYDDIMMGYYDYKENKNSATINGRPSAWHSSIINFKKRWAFVRESSGVGYSPAVAGSYIYILYNVNSDGWFLYYGLLSTGFYTYSDISNKSINFGYFAYPSKCFYKYRGLTISDSDDDYILFQADSIVYKVNKNNYNQVAEIDMTKNVGHLVYSTGNGNETTYVSNIRFPVDGKYWFMSKTVNQIVGVDVKTGEVTTETVPFTGNMLQMCKISNHRAAFIGSSTGTSTLWVKNENDEWVQRSHSFSKNDIMTGGFYWDGSKTYHALLGNSTEIREESLDPSTNMYVPNVGSMSNTTTKIVAKSLAIED